MTFFANDCLQNLAKMRFCRFYLVDFGELTILFLCKMILISVSLKLNWLKNWIKSRLL